MHRKIRVAITMGDPSGVGPALIAKGLRLLPKDAEYIVIGDAGVLRRLSCVPAGLIDLANVGPRDFQFGRISKEYGRASIDYIDRALDLISSSRADCLVTCPISKEAVHRAGFAFPGHTGYLASRAGARHTVMLLMNEHLKAALVTQHLPLRRVASAVTEDGIYRTIATTVMHLGAVWGIPRPRIIVCALNPHASDNGLLGDEEARIIRPAVRRAQGLSADVAGPLSADTALYLAAQGSYDCAVAMYHDQVLIPLKVTGPDSGVNMTAGLPYIRTSPLHGTAFDVAGDLSLVREGSFVAAVQAAVACARRQRGVS